VRARCLTALALMPQALAIMGPVQFVASVRRASEPRRARPRPVQAAQRARAAFCRAATPSNRLRSEVLIVMDILVRMRQTRLPAPAWESQVGFKCQIRSTRISNVSDLAAPICDRLVLIANGQVMAEGSADTVLSDANLASVYDIEVACGVKDGVPYVMPCR
jgi:hypothetical protein